MQRIRTRPGKLCRKVCVLGQGRGRDRRLVGAVPLIIGYTGYNIIVSGHISWFILVSAGNFHGYRSYTYMHACIAWHDMTWHYITFTLQLHLHLTFTFTLHYITLHVRMYTCMYIYIYPLRTPWPHPQVWWWMTQAEYSRLFAAANKLLGRNVICNSWKHSLSWGSRWLR
jgi:hypothetical protein